METYTEREREGTLQGHAPPTVSALWFVWGALV